MRALAIMFLAGCGPPIHHAPSTPSIAPAHGCTATAHPVGLVPLLAGFADHAGSYGYFSASTTTNPAPAVHIHTTVIDLTTGRQLWSLPVKLVGSLEGVTLALEPSGAGSRLVAIDPDGKRCFASETFGTHPFDTILSATVEEPLLTLRARFSNWHKECCGGGQPPTNPDVAVAIDLRSGHVAPAPPAVGRQAIWLLLSEEKRNTVGGRTFESAVVTQPNGRRDLMLRARNAATGDWLWQVPWPPDAGAPQK